MKIALVSCSKAKQSYACKAGEMYLPSSLFSYSYQYAKGYVDRVYILSAKYGLVAEDTVIEPYELTLKHMSTNEKLTWSNIVIEQLKLECDLENDEFIILAGKEYYQYLLCNINNYQLPLGNKTQGCRIAFLKNELNSVCNYIGGGNVCLKLHELLNTAPRFTYDNIEKIPFDNGIYIVFQNGEKYKGLDRIVRVGTHDAPNRLKMRLKDHFVRENKDGSIFRKNIGLSILNKDNDEYIQIWSVDTSKPQNKVLINIEKQNVIEHKVTEYLRHNFSFTCFRVDNKELRLRLEKGIIASLNMQKDFTPSDNWLGKYSPYDKIRDSGLWLKIGLDAQELSKEEFIYIKSSTSNNYEIENKPMCTLQRDKKVINNLISNKVKTSTKDIINYIEKILSNAKREGKTEYVLVSGDIHKKMNLSNKMPSVCSAMYQVMKLEDEIINTTPSGKSSTIKVKYKL